MYHCHHHYHIIVITLIIIIIIIIIIIYFGAAWPTTIDTTVLRAGSKVRPYPST